MLFATPRAGIPEQPQEGGVVGKLGAGSTLPQVILAVRSSSRRSAYVPLRELFIIYTKGVRRWSPHRLCGQVLYDVIRHYGSATVLACLLPWPSRLCAFRLKTFRLPVNMRTRATSQRRASTSHVCC